MQKRALERKPLAHPTRKTGDVVVSAIGKVRARERRPDDRLGIEAVQPREEFEVLPGGELGVEVKFVRQEANPFPQFRSGRPGRQVAVTYCSRARRDKRREHANDRGFAGAVRSEKAEDLAARDRQRDLRYGATPAKIAREARYFDAVEVQGHDGMASSVSSDPYNCSSDAMSASRRSV